MCNISLGRIIDGTMKLPDDVGELVLLSQRCRDKITYYDWNLNFKKEIFAMRPDNFGKDEIQLIFNLNQTIEWQIDGGREVVNMMPGEVCVFRNNDYQTSMNYSPSVEFLFKSLQMSTSYFEELLIKYFPSDQIETCKSFFLTHVTKTLITKDMYRVLSEIDSSEKYQEFKGVFVEGKMIELIAMVLYGISYNKTEYSPCKAFMNVCQDDIKRLESLRRRIQFFPQEEYRACDIAKDLSMSESKMTRLFRSLYGTSLHRYVQNKRLEKAASILVDGGVNISEAAIKSGYTNMSHFSKEFQKKFGISPKKFSLKA
ncbi:MAG: AraC family transcriptional regulator [Treponemataceae bacterium]|nr:AraC family transcriptional regulator [Treponemataceae bacterium]